MKKNIKTMCMAAVSIIALSGAVSAASQSVSDEQISEQRAMLGKNTQDAGFGPQSPRDIDEKSGNNPRTFGEAPPYTKMNLCNIHFHENAEHKGGEFTKHAGNGNGKGAGTGFVYDGELTEEQIAPLDHKIGEGEYGDLAPGDTIELHYVYSSAQIEPGPTLAACLSESISNPQLRVEAQVFVLVNDESAADFTELTKHEVVDGFHQAVNIPANTGDPVQYAGSTTGPKYNEKASPLQVSWSVRPQVIKVDIATVETWLKDNAFEEAHAHGVRNLITNPDLLSPIN